MLGAAGKIYSWQTEAASPAPFHARDDVATMTMVGPLCHCPEHRVMSADWRAMLVVISLRVTDLVKFRLEKKCTVTKSSERCMRERTCIW